MKLKKKDLPSMVKGSIPYSTVKLKKKDFGKWDEEELSLIIKGYTARQIADHLLDNQKIVDGLRKLNMSNILRYTGTKKGDKYEKHNYTVNEIKRLLQ